jgi:hypothetical protein
MRVLRFPFCRDALAAIGVALVLLSVSATAALGQGVQSPWGLRNVNAKPWGLNEWPACPEFEQAFADHEAGHINFWIQWFNVEPPESTCPVGNSACDPVATYDWTLLHSGLDKVLSVGAAPVINFKLAHAGLMEFPGTSTLYSRPKDMSSPGATPQFPTPTTTMGVHGSFSGYSERLYLVAKAMAEQIVARYEETIALPTCAPAISSRDVYLVFHPESWDEWPLGATANWSTNLNTYILSYLTVRQAFKDVEATTTLVAFKLSHGSIPRWRVLADRWYQQGEAGSAALKEALVTRFRSYTERIPGPLDNLASGGVAIGPTIDNWTEVGYYASADPSNPCTKARDNNQKNDAWLAAFVDWIYDGYFDFNTYHGHAKPRWDDQERVYFDQQVAEAIAAGGSAITAPQPWMITEAAFEVLDPNGDWPAFAGSEQQASFLANRDRFAMEDYARRWCTFLAQDTVAFGSGTAVEPGDILFGFCSPVVAGNNLGGSTYPNYTGLNELCGASGQGECGLQAQPGSGTTLQRMDPNPANQAFVSLSQTIGVPDTSRTVVDGSHVQLRFDRSASAGKVIDVLWKKEWLDITVNPVNVAVQAPGSYRTAQVLTLDAQGNLDSGDAIYTQVDQIILLELTQTPRFVIWTP